MFINNKEQKNEKQSYKSACPNGTLAGSMPYTTLQDFLIVRFIYILS